jgi:LmbE family N-acetylglucosaminyl deacetylase/glycosyltransferase involved in cell wall biosynthesis
MPSVLIEAESIPYEPARLLGERLLVLAPHPDDEVIGCGGVVAQHLREGRKVLVVVATDGGQAGSPSEREEESRRALDRVGGGAEVVFLRFRDRLLDDMAAGPIAERIADFLPDLILAPSPIEIHPDHLALSRIFCELLQRDEKLWAALAVSRVAFYEVGQPIRPNALVDISDVAEEKYAAIAEHVSQIKTRDYVSYARGLNAYRAMTLSAETKFAEAYYVVDAPSLRTTSFSELRRRVGEPRSIEVTGEQVPISVIVRTKDRPALLREALESIQATRYPAEIIVVNDGGQRPELSDVALINHDRSRGRSEAANSGVKAAKNRFVTFLDDDDIYYPEHLATLSRAAQATPAAAAWYTDAVSSFLKPGESGAHETHTRLRIYAQDFDADLLLFDNYIPLPTLLIPRDSFIELGGFDPAFDLFEDWDFLIRLARRGSLQRVPRITCEIRHFEGGSSVVLSAPEGSDRFRAAKKQIWTKHASLIDADATANAFERQKRRLNAIYSDFVTATGQTSHASREVARLEREQSHANNTINGYALRVRELEGAMEALAAMAGDYEHKTTQVERMSREIDSLRTANSATSEDLLRARNEISRLTGLLDMIYASKTWKMHTMLEKMRGRG